MGSKDGYFEKHAIDCRRPLGGDCTCAPTRFPAAQLTGSTALAVDLTACQKENFRLKQALEQSDSLYKMLREQHELACEQIAALKAKQEDLQNRWDEFLTKRNNPAGDPFATRGKWQPFTEQPVPLPPRTCNRHTDCRAADAAAVAKGAHRADHCYDEGCEECFGN